MTDTVVVTELSSGVVEVVSQGPQGPSGLGTATAGGVLSGNYPNPGFAVDMATQAELDAVSAAKQSVSGKDASGGYPGLTLFKLNLRNAANTFTSWFTTAATAARTWTMPDKDGTVAMTSDFAAPGAIGGTTPAAGTFTTLTSTGNAALGDTEASDTHAIKGATTLLANSASAALTVTQTGAGNAFVVEDSASTDSTPFVIDASGRTLIGHTATVANSYATNPNLQVHTGTGTSDGVAEMRWGADVNGPSHFFMKSRSATIGTHAVVLNGDNLGGLLFAGSDAAAFINAASIYAQVDGTPGTNDMPGRLVFSTTADGQSSPTERMRIDSAGNVGIGATAIAANRVYVGGSITGSTTGVNYYAVGTAASDVTALYVGFRTFLNTQDAAFSLAQLTHYGTVQSTITGGSRLAVTNQIGFEANSTLTGATNNYGFYSSIASAANRYNFYADGTADNYFAGSVGIGAVPYAGTDVNISKALTGSTSGYGLAISPTVNSDITSAAYGVNTYIGTQTASFTLPTLYHFSAGQNTLGANSIVTTQIGFSTRANLTGATNNFGFYSNIASAANRYNFYAAGSADNYFAGNTGIGASPTYRFDVTGIVANVAAFRRSGGQAAYFYIDTTDVYIGSDSSVTNSIKFTPGSNALALLTNNASRLSIDSAGAVTVAGNLTANGQTVGYLNIPQNSQSAPYTLVIGDAGKHILHPSADTTARTITIPANSSVAFPIGTAVTFVNQASAGVMTIAITTDTMRLAGAGTTGSRTLAANGVATAIKLTSTEWIISGTNLT